MSARNCAVFHRLMFNVALIFNIELGDFNAVSAEKRSTTICSNLHICVN